MKDEGGKQRAEGKEQRAGGEKPYPPSKNRASCPAFWFPSLSYRLLPVAYYLVLAVWVALAAGCGYSFSGIGEGFPEGVRSVFVEPFVNRSTDVSIDREMTSALRSEFHQQRQLRVVNRLEEADAVLSGVIRSLDSRVVAVNRRDAALQLETALVVDMTLRRRNPDEVLWRTQGTKLTEVYAGSRGAVVTSSTDFKQGTLNPEDLFPFTDIQLTEALSQEARERLVGRFAHELHQRLIEMF